MKIFYSLEYKYQKILAIMTILSVIFLSLTYSYSYFFSEKQDKIIITDDTTLLGSKYAAQLIAPEKSGFIVYDPITNKTILSHNRNKSFIPASTTKIPTVLAAFDILGNDFRFTTNLYYTGSIKNGVITGNLYLKGTGDPHFTTTDLNHIVMVLIQKGIKTIKGKFYYDKSELTFSSILDKKMDKDRSFNTGISSLSLEYNTMRAEWQKGKKSDEIKLSLTPNLPIFETGILDNDSSDSTKFTYKEFDDKCHWLISKKIKRKKGTHYLPIRKPALYTAHFFKKLCQIHKIYIPYPTKSTVPDNASLLYSHKSKPLKTISAITLRYSINLMAELLFLTTAKKLANKKQSFIESGKIIKEYFVKTIPNINWKNFKIVNGSGLTSKNRITPEQMLAFMIYANNKDYEGHSFHYFLKTSGWSLSPTERFKNSDSDFRIYAKTGTINYAVSLSGYLYAKSGKKFLFAFFTSDKKLRDEFENNPKRRDKDSIKHAKKWHKEQIKTMDDIIIDWVNKL
jgi:D-alanyl-D-alanine carboxypeptidase/D-alanyl-D-alanine-endopeptidase (penicillin-binding protein 4)